MYRLHAKRCMNKLHFYHIPRDKCRVVPAVSLSAVISTMLRKMIKKWVRWHFLLMVEIHAIKVPLDMANQTRVDDKPENALQHHRKVKGQMSAFLGPEKLCRPVNPLMYAIKSNSS